MKRFVLHSNFFVLIYFLLTITLLSSDAITEYQLVFMDLYGTVSNSKAVVIWGENCNILISTDKGESWSQKAIVGNLVSNINKIKVVDETFYGLIDSTIIILSNDGLSWSKYSIPVDDKFADITADESFLYLLNSDKNKVYMLTRTGFLLVDSINLDYRATELFSFNSTTFLGTDQGKLIIFNKSNEKVELDLTSIGNYIYNFFPDDGKVYFTVGTTLCFFNDIDNTVNVILQNAPSNCVVKNGEIYSVKVETYFIFNKYLNKWISFYKYDKEQKQFLKVNSDTIYHFIEQMNLFLPVSNLNINFIDNNRIIIATRNKTIIMSKNGGKNFELISFIPKINRPPKVLNNYLWAINSKTVFRSTDYGITWLPQKADSLFIVNLNSMKGFTFFYFDSSGKGFIVNDLEYYYPDTNRNFEILYTNDFGENYVRGENKKLVWLKLARGETQIVRFKDKFILKQYSISNIDNNKLPFSHFEFFDTNFTATGYRLFNDTILYKIFFLGNTDTLFGYFVKGNFSNISQLVSDTTLTTWIGYTTDGINWYKLFDTELSYFSQTIDETSKGLVCFNERVYDSLFIQYKIHFIDVKNRKTILLLNREIPFEVINFFDYPTIQFYNIERDRILYSDYLDSTLYVCDVSEQIVPKWEKSNFLDTLFKYFGWENIYLPLRVFLASKDSILFFFVSTPNGSNFVRVIIDDSNVNNVVDENERGGSLNKLFVQTLPPFPIPAKNLVKTKIYIEKFQEIEPEYFRIYDINGKLVDNPVNISVEKLLPFLFEASFDVSNLPNGVYLIRYVKPESQFMFLIVVDR